MAQQNSIIIIFNDDHGQWALGSYGNKEIRTPALDYLAQSGVQMDNAFTPIPVCSPARACFLTGLLPSQHGVHDYLASGSPGIDERDWIAGEATLPQILRQNGYQTGLAGKWHLGNDEIHHPDFDFWFSLTSDYPVEHGGKHRYCDNGRIKTIHGYKTQIITDQAIRFLRERDGKRPFFLFIGYTATHSPWSDHTQRLVTQYQNCTFNDIPPDTSYPFGRQNLESTLPTRNNPRAALAQYYAAVSQLDEGCGRLLDELEAQNLREDTLLVYTSDHGLCCGHHGIWGKGNGTLPLNMVEEAIRIPMIFNQPRTLYEQQHRREFVDHLDLFQTLVEHAGIKIEPQKEGSYPGRSFLPWLTNASNIPNWRNAQYCEYGNLRMIRTDKYKLVRRYPDGPCELIDLPADPRESINLFDDPAHQSIVAHLTQQLEAYFTTYEDPVKSGLRVRELPRHNATEAWRNE
jgi:arylsulfatase A-like enzyme